MFTDNQNPVNLLALDIETGKVVASHPVLDELPKGTQVSIENSAIVYDHGDGTVSTVVCNWFGAGSANLANSDSDSSIQSYENIYDVNWISKGNEMISPGIERIDTIKKNDGYEMKSIWCREDLRDTSMMKLSTAAGYIYGYVQDLESGMWQYIILDFETGETVFTMDVSNQAGYNNMAIGMYAGDSGNALYCPTGTLELLRLQDRFVYLPDAPYKGVNLDDTSRKQLSDTQFKKAGGKGTVISWIHSAEITNIQSTTTVAFRMNGLSGQTDDLSLYAYGKDGHLIKVPSKYWHIQDEQGAAPSTLEDSTLYEIHLSITDNGDYDLNQKEKTLKTSVVLAR